MKTFPLYVQDEWIDVYVLDRRAFRGCRGGVVIVVVAEQIRREEKKEEGKNSRQETIILRMRSNLTNAFR